MTNLTVVLFGSGSQSFFTSSVKGGLFTCAYVITVCHPFTCEQPHSLGLQSQGNSSQREKSIVTVQIFEKSHYI